MLLILIDDIITEGYPNRVTFFLCLYINKVITIRKIDNHIYTTRLVNKEILMCGKVKRHTTESFIEKAKKKHGDKYDYSKVIYKNNFTKVEIICFTHGSFWQRPYEHLTGAGCRKCSTERNKILSTKTTEEYVSQVKKIHGNRYDYSKVIYKGDNDKIEIGCSVHGGFWQRARVHLIGAGCKKCAGDKLRIEKSGNTKDFVSKSTLTHKHKYDYSKVQYTNSKIKVEIVCPVHGSFWQKPSTHLSGFGCKKCANAILSDIHKSNSYDFISKAREIHGDRYNYDKVSYTSAIIPVEIECSVHGSFHQKPNKHLSGQGCPKCKSSRGEQSVLFILDKHNIDHIREWWYPDETHKFRYDFYLPVQNVIIEYHGAQHYEQIKHFYKTEDEFIRRKDIDRFKVHMAKAKLTPLIELKDIPHKQLQEPEFEELLLKIINNIQSRPRPKYNLHLLVEYNNDNNKYKVRYI